VVAHLTRHRLAFADDPSNQNRRFLRTRVRHELLPLLEQLSPQVVAHLCALADALCAAPGSEAAVFDEQGVALLLNRAQRQLVGRARSLGQRSARVSLPNGRELSLDPVTLEPQVALVSPAGRRPRKR
jgi:tRNA(Ile)-lysidine synthase